MNSLRTSQRPVTLTVITGLVLISIASLVFGFGCDRNRLPTEKQEHDFALFAARNNLWNEAKFRFENIARLKPNSVNAHNNLAVALEALGEFKQAEISYRRALELDPNNLYIQENYKRLRQILEQEQKKAVDN